MQRQARRADRQQHDDAESHGQSVTDLEICKFYVVLLRNDEDLASHYRPITARLEPDERAISGAFQQGGDANSCFNTCRRVNLFTTRHHRGLAHKPVQPTSTVSDPKVENPASRSKASHALADDTTSGPR